MIEDYKALAVFVAVAEAGSFSAAGRNLKLSTSVVSHHVSKLEARLGVSLLFRSTRSLSLTTEGQRVLEAGQRMVAAGTEALDALTAISRSAHCVLQCPLLASGT
ncbi:MAG: LysR family transcriptional regulator [Hyphomicrobiales bacterium]|nr:LysR family transcriptional regulator [Hyphomicrobiales bacterium]